MEAAGIEPSVDFDATVEELCDCESCQQCRTAYALHEACFNGQLLTSNDADLQKVIVAWGRLSDVIRNAILIVVEPQRQCHERTSMRIPRQVEIKFLPNSLKNARSTLVWLG